MKLSTFFFTLSNKIRKVGIRLSTNNPWRNILARWKRDNQNTDLRLEYPALNEESLVFDLGGYEGQWASDIFAKYRCKVIVFEPYQKYADAIDKRFRKNSSVEVFALGLSNKTYAMKIGVHADSTSVFKAKQGDRLEEITLTQTDTFLSEHGYRDIDLMKINIEGGEYDLLDHLIETGLISNIQNLQIQFHDFVPNAKNRMKNIQEAMLKTHELTYHYEFLWENWRRMLT